ncbi:MAG TPA: SRPBCC family protein [Bdellovibrionota bacterium]|jgi:uncharacterized protein YndB with AHSA1/START domain|nr:SRPBCC family protein [Bdellovibrionota bacterium]
MPKNEEVFVYVTYIRTTPEKLWDALTTPEFTRQYWFGIEVKSEWLVGSAMRYLRDGETLVEGEVLRSERPRLLAYTFRETKTVASHEPPTRVTLEIEDCGGGDQVKLTVTHKGFVQNSKHLPSISAGWPAVLSGLKSLIETGKPMKIEP